MVFAAVGAGVPTLCFSNRRASYSNTHYPLSFSPYSFTQKVNKLCGKPISICCKPPSFSVSGQPICPRNKEAQSFFSNPLSFLTSLLKPVSASIILTSILLSGFHLPCLAVPISPSSTSESSTYLNTATLSSTSHSDTVLSEEESSPESKNEKMLEEHADANPSDVSALESLLETKIKLEKFSDAIDVVERLILLCPQENLWHLIKARLFLQSGDLAYSKFLFEEIISKDPFSVPAYHSLMIISMEADPASIEEQLNRVHEMIEICNRDHKTELSRDFKLLVAQVKVSQEKYEEALGLYSQLVEEDPRDFRPHLCQSVLYSLMGKKDKAEKHFEEYLRLVPKDHPYAEFLKQDEIAKKILSGVREGEKTLLDV